MQSRCHLPATPELEASALLSMRGMGTGRWQGLSQKRHRGSDLSHKEQPRAQANRYAIDSDALALELQLHRFKLSYLGCVPGDYANWSGKLSVSREQAHLCCRRRRDRSRGAAVHVA